MFDKVLSAEVYNRLMNGKVINKYNIDKKGDKYNDVLFSEIILNLDDYKKQYEMSGFELVSGYNFFYIRNGITDSIKADVSKKISVLLLVISRHVTKKGYKFDKLSNPKGGITNNELLEIEDLDETKELMEKSEMGKMKFHIAVKRVLVDRGIMLEKVTGEFILSDAGISFFNDLFSSYSE
jgi:hypothetical protein